MRALFFLHLPLQVVEKLLAGEVLSGQGVEVLVQLLLGEAAVAAAAQVQEPSANR